MHWNYFGSQKKKKQRRGVKITRSIKHIYVEEVVEEVEETETTPSPEPIVLPEPRPPGPVRWLSWLATPVAMITSIILAVNSFPAKRNEFSFEQALDQVLEQKVEEVLEQMLEQTLEPTSEPPPENADGVIGKIRDKIPVGETINLRESTTREKAPIARIAHGNDMKILRIAGTDWYEVFVDRAQDHNTLEWVNNIRGFVEAENVKVVTPFSVTVKDSDGNDIDVTVEEFNTVESKITINGGAEETVDTSTLLKFLYDSSD